MESEKMPDDPHIISEMLMAYIDGSIWPDKTSNYGVMPNEERGMKNVLALLVSKGYRRVPADSCATAGDAERAKALGALDLIENQLKNGKKSQGFARPVIGSEKILWKTLTVEMPRDVRKAFLENLPTIRAALSGENK